MKINWLLVLGLGAGAIVLYNIVKNSSAPALTGQPTSYTATTPGQTITMKIGDTLSVSGASGTPTASGADIFNGAQTVLTNGSANAVAAGTETLSWPGWGSITVIAS